MTLLEQRIQAVATRPRVTPQGAVFPRSDYVYTAVPTSLKYMLNADGEVIEESEGGTDTPVLYVYEADAYYKQVSQKAFDDTQDADKPIFTKDTVDGVYKAATEIRLVSAIALVLDKEVLAVNRGAYFEVISVLDESLTPWTLVPTATSGTYRIYIPDGSLILYLLSVSSTNIVDVSKGVITIDPPPDAFGADWYTVTLLAGDVYVAIEYGVVKITNSPPEYGSRIACIIDAESGNIEQIASSTVTLLIEEDSPDAPEPEDPSEAPPCGHPGNGAGAGGETPEGDDTDHPGDDFDVGEVGDDDIHPGDTAGDNGNTPTCGDAL
jgi:hypothetical protein